MYMSQAMSSYVIYCCSVRSSPCFSMVLTGPEVALVRFILVSSNVIICGILVSFNG